MLCYSAMLPLLYCIAISKAPVQGIAEQQHSQQHWQSSFMTLQEIL